VKKVTLTPEPGGKTKEAKMRKLSQLFKATDTDRNPNRTEAQPIRALGEAELDKVAGARKICIYGSGGEVDCFHIP
jgi:hypothetical protein